MADRAPPWLGTMLEDDDDDETPSSPPCDDTSRTSGVSQSPSPYGPVAAGPLKTHGLSVGTAMRGKNPPPPPPHLTGGCSAPPPSSPIGPLNSLGPMNTLESSETKERLLAADDLNASMLSPRGSLGVNATPKRRALYMRSEPTKKKMTTFYKRMLNGDAKEPPEDASASEGASQPSRGDGECKNCSKYAKYQFTCCGVKRCRQCAPQELDALVREHGCFQSRRVGVCGKCRTAYHNKVSRLTCCGSELCETCMFSWYTKYSVNKYCALCRVSFATGVLTPVAHLSAEDRREQRPPQQPPPQLAPSARTDSDKAAVKKQRRLLKRCSGTTTVVCAGAKRLSVHHAPRRLSAQAGGSQQQHQHQHHHSNTSANTSGSHPPKSNAMGIQTNVSSYLNTLSAPYREVVFVRQKSGADLTRALGQQKHHIDNNFLEMAVHEYLCKGPELLRRLIAQRPAKLLLEEPLRTVPGHLLTVHTFTLSELRALHDPVDETTQRCSNTACLTVLVKQWKREYGNLPSLSQTPGHLRYCLLCMLFEAESVVQRWAVDEAPYVDAPLCHALEYVFGLDFDRDVGAAKVRVDPRDSFKVLFKSLVGVVKPTHYYPTSDFVRRMEWKTDGSGVLFH